MLSIIIALSLMAVLPQHDYVGFLAVYRKRLSGQITPTTTSTSIISEYQSRNNDQEI